MPPIDPSDDVGVTRVSVDMRAPDAGLAEQYAAYRNALAVAQGKRLRRQWTKKSMVEAMLAMQADTLRHQLAQLVAALGEMPKPEDEAAMVAYAERALALDKKLPK